MSATATITKSFAHGGKTFNESKTISADHAIQAEVDVPAAQTGVLTTRTSDTAGTITMDSESHTIVTGQRISIFWSGGQQHTATVGTVAGQSVPFTLGEGDILPAASTAVSVATPEELDVTVTGDNVVGILLYSAVIGAFVFTEADQATDWARILGATSSFQWNMNEDMANPIATKAIEKVFISHGNAAAQTMRLALLYDQ